jgi:hypothetical protein
MKCRNFLPLPVYTLFVELFDKEMASGEGIKLAIMFTVMLYLNKRNTSNHVFQAHICPKYSPHAICFFHRKTHYEKSWPSPKAEEVWTYIKTTDHYTGWKFPRLCKVSIWIQMIVEGLKKSLTFKYISSGRIVMGLLTVLQVSQD